ncbi:MAG: ATPase [Deltaproteobacteria bacterium]|nr:ATPase [Deltaproteobacteria bacterium]
MTPNGRRPWRKLMRMHPAMLLVSSFLAVIVLGALLLLLPAASTSGSISVINALFTATSAVCVTGLVVVDTGAYFTAFGQCVILFLIQIGGLGVMTISVMLFRLVGRNVSFRQRMVLQDVFAHTPRSDIFQILGTIFAFTAIVELSGVALLFIHWHGEYPAGKALYMAVFHSISAFCNAGFALFENSMMNYSGDVLLNLSMCSLIVLGGIGFPVVYDIYCNVRDRNARRFRLAVQTKTVLVITAVLILVGAGVFGVLEESRTLSGKSAMESALDALFQSVTCRTAGFNTVDIAGLSDATLVLMMFLMFFGASPGSCGGGVKTTTLALLAAFSWSRIRGARRVNMFKRSVPPETVTRSMSLILVSVGLIGLVLFMVLLDDASGRPDNVTASNHFLARLFEVVSAFGTVGLSMGATAALSAWDKSWIILLMFVGRVGVLTFSYIIAGGRAGNGLEFAEENVMIG